MIGQFILDETGSPAQCDNIVKWGEWMAEHDDERRVARTNIDGVDISTVFLGLDHNSGNGPPLLFETMAFGGPNGIDQECERYTTREEAEAGHRRMCDRVAAALMKAGQCGSP
jgi:hypothetical protein